MKLCHLPRACVIAAAAAFYVAPASAGIPVVDTVAVIRTAIDKVMDIIRWGVELQDRLNEWNSIKEQTTKLAGARDLGTILDDPTVRSVLPFEMRNAATAFLNPSALSSSPAAISATLASFGITSTTNPADGRGSANSLVSMNNIMASVQQRETLLNSLASRVDTSADAKDSADLMNRNIIEAARINNQNMQTMALIESNRVSEQLRIVAKSQANQAQREAGAALPLRNIP